VICVCPHITPLRRRRLGGKTSWEAYSSPGVCSLWRFWRCCGWLCRSIAGLGWWGSMVDDGPMESDVVPHLVEDPVALLC